MAALEPLEAAAWTHRVFPLKAVYQALFHIAAEEAGARHRSGESLVDAVAASGEEQYGFNNEVLWEAIKPAVLHAVDAGCCWREAVQALNLPGKEWSDAEWNFMERYLVRAHRGALQAGTADMGQMIRTLQLCGDGIMSLHAYLKPRS